jgi:hypothetical protein
VTDCTLVTSAHEGRRFISANVPWHPTERNRPGSILDRLLSNSLVGDLQMLNDHRRPRPSSKKHSVTHGMRVQDITDSQSILRDYILLQLSSPPRPYFLLFVVFRNHLAKGQVTRARSYKFSQNLQVQITNSMSTKWTVHIASNSSIRNRLQRSDQTHAKTEVINNAPIQRCRRHRHRRRPPKET